MPTSVVLPESQELALLALVESGAYKTQSEILRSAVEQFIHRTPRSTLIAAAVWAYKEGKVTLSKAARMANIEHEEMQRTLVREGVFDSRMEGKQIQEGAALLASRIRHNRDALKKTR